MSESSLTRVPATARLSGGIVIALAGLALILSVMASWEGGRPIWRGLVGSMGVGLLGFALIIGRQRRRLYYALIGVSFALSVLSLGLGILGWW